MLMPGLDERAPLVGRVDELDRLAGLVGLTSDEPLPESAVLLAGDAGVGKTRLLAELRDRAVERRAGGSSSATASTSATAPCPTCRSARSSAGWPPSARARPSPWSTAAPAVARLHAGPPGAPRAGRRLGRRRGRPPGPRRPVRGGALGPRADSAGRPRCCCSSRTSTGPTSRPATCSASCSPAGSTRRWRSSPPTAPTTCTAATRCAPPSPSGPGCPASTGSQLGRLADDDVRALVDELHPAPLPRPSVRGIVERAEGNAFFTEELVAAAELGTGCMPDDLADLLLVRLDQLDDDARLRRPGRRRRRPPGRRTSCSPRRRLDGQVGSLDRSLRAAVERNVLVPRGDALRASGTPCSAEAVYDDLLPGERVRLHAAYAARPAAGRGAAARRPSWPGTPGRPTTCPPRRAPASTRATRRWPWPAPTRPPTTTSWPSSWPPQVGLDETELVELTAKACEAALAAGQTYRALALARDQLRATSPDASPHARLPDAAGQGVDRTRRDTEGRRADEHHRGPALVPDEVPRRAGARRGARPARPGAGRGAPAGRGRRSRQRRAGARRLAWGWPVSPPTPAPRWRGCASARVTPAASKAMLQKTIGQARAAGEPGRRAARPVQPRHPALRDRRRSRGARRVLPRWPSAAPAAPAGRGRRTAWTPG